MQHLIGHTLELGTPKVRTTRTTTGGWAYQAVPLGRQVDHRFGGLHSLFPRMHEDHHLPDGSVQAWDAPER